MHFNLRNLLIDLMIALVIMILSLCSTSISSAEQAAAEQYRQMFKSGNFYVEYQMFRDCTWNGKEYSNIYSNIMVLAGKNGNRMQRSTVPPKKGFKLYSPYYYDTMFVGTNLSDVYFTTDVSMRPFIETLRVKHFPDFMYKNGKYYQFFSENRAILAGITFPKSKNKAKLSALVLPEDKLNSPNLKYAENWDLVESKLSLPDELAIFYWNDKFHANPFGLTPYYNGSSTRTIEDKDYECDQYLIDIKSMAGTNMAQEAYNMIYENGQLVMTQKYLILDGKEILIRTIKISALTSDVPEDAFTIGPKCNVYAAGTGDMNDLMERSILVEEIGGDKQ